MTWTWEHLIDTLNHLADAAEPPPTVELDAPRTLLRVVRGRDRLAVIEEANGRVTIYATTPASRSGDEAPFRFVVPRDAAEAALAPLGLRLAA